MAKDQKEPKEEKDLKWKGLNVDLLKRFRLRFCRLETRAGLRPPNLDRWDSDDLAGSLISQAYDWASPKSRGAGFPNLTALGEICNPPVRLNVLNKFLGANAPRRTHWFKNARDMLRLMLVGEEPDEKSEEYKIYQTIEDYFFRKWDETDPTKPPAFFHRARPTADPWSRNEIASEIFAILYKHELAGWPAEVIWVSGGWPYFPEGVDKPVAYAVANAARGGVQVTFVHHSALSKLALADNLGDFYETYQWAKGDRLAEMDLAEKEYQNTPGWHGFVSPIIQYLYLKVTSPNPLKTEENLALLYIVRPAKEAKNGQAALLAAPLEQRGFEQWLAQLRRAKPASPVEKSQSKSRK